MNNNTEQFNKVLNVLTQCNYDLNAQRKIKQQGLLSSPEKMNKAGIVEKLIKAKLHETASIKNVNLNDIRFLSTSLTNDTLEGVIWGGSGEFVLPDSTTELCWFVAKVIDHRACTPSSNNHRSPKGKNLYSVLVMGYYNHDIFNVVVQCTDYGPVGKSTISQRPALWEGLFDEYFANKAPDSQCA